MNKKICVITAMYDELNSFFQKEIDDIVMLEEKPYLIYSYKDHLLVVCKIGLINAATCLTYVATKYAPETYINIGLAGAPSDKWKLLDTVVITKALHGGVDATNAGPYLYGQTPQEFRELFSDAELLAKVKACGVTGEGVLASSDSFINSEKLFTDNFSQLDEEIDVMDMEGYALFQVARRLWLRFVAVKVVSDVLTKKEDNEMQFDEFLSRGSDKIADILVKYLQ